MHAVLEHLRGGLIVSCQALEGEPLYGAEFMARMALAAAQAGAVGIRANSPVDIRAIRAMVSLPVIGLWKRDYPNSPVYITATRAEEEAVIEAGAQIVAIDATDRVRPDGRTTVQAIREFKRDFGGGDVLLMADCATLHDAYVAQNAGVDLVGTTMSGYTPDSPQLISPDWDLIEALAKQLQVPLIAEGRISTPDEAASALSLGAFAAAVGGAITRPQQIARKFVQALQQDRSL